MFTDLISTDDLNARFHDGNVVSVDCRFDLTNPDWGEQQYHTAHIPGAVYAHLNRDLSSAPTGANGRHPLPDPSTFMRRLGYWGIEATTQVIVYDQDLGMFAARLWWMLRYLGHDAAAVLDGGFSKWMSEGRLTSSGDEQRRPTTFVGVPHESMRVTAADVERLRANPQYLLIDARAPERYRGEVEPIDPVGGHIPGAVNHFYQANLRSDGTFLPAHELRKRFNALFAGRSPINYCGSGVSACHNALAMKRAGLPDAQLYVGSWSEWCSDPNRPLATGD